MSNLCVCKKKNNLKCILNSCKKCCFARTCSVHINNKKINKYNFMCSICLLACDKNLLNSYYNSEIGEIIYYCYQCYSSHNIVFDNIIAKTFHSHIFNFDVPKKQMYKSHYDIQISLFCPCGCGCFSTDDELFDDEDDDESDMSNIDIFDDKQIIFSRSDSPVEPATDKSNECNICYINKKNYACIPCGHLCMCKICASKITEKCPICNIKITHITKIFS